MKNRKLSLYLTARLVSLTGDSLGSVALLWWTITSTGSASTASMVMGAYSFCFALGLPFFGVLSDRVPRRVVMMLSELVNVIVTAILAILSTSSTANLYLFVALMLLKATAAAALSSASTGFIKEICMGKSVMHAFKYISYIVGTAGLLGGVAGGALVAAWGPAVAIAIDALSCLVGAALLFLIGAQSFVSNQPGNSVPYISWAAQLKEGAAFLWKSFQLRSYIVWFVIFSFAYGPLVVLFAILVKDVYHLGAIWLGGIEFALAAGVLVGGIVSNRLQVKFGTKDVTIVNMLGVGCGYLLIGFSGGGYATAGGALILGVSFTLLNINVTSRLWAHVPDDMSSRITSIFTLIGRTSAAISLMLLAYLVQNIDVSTIVILLGMAWGLVCAVLIVQKDFLLIYTEFESAMSVNK